MSFLCDSPPSPAMLSSSSMQRKKAQMLKAKYPHTVRDVQHFLLREIFHLRRALCHNAILLLKELIISLCFRVKVSTDMISALLYFKLSLIKGSAWRWLLTVCCQSDTPDQSLCSSEGRSFSHCKVTTSKPSQAHWKGKLVVHRKMKLLNHKHYFPKILLPH